ncbi:MAG TPA: C-GCAxxG-C-C family protein [Anaerolineae bacterium]|nr:C-GCAxxG-C-C family protein [Anaerolineae bacterium]
MLAVGEDLLDPLDQRIRRMACALGGGLGGSHQEACGALTGGALVLGALYARTSPDQEDTDLYRRVSAFRDRFLVEFGFTRCCDLQASGFGSEGIHPCSELVARASRLLLDAIQEQ